MTMYMPPMSTKKRTEEHPENGLAVTRRVFGNYDENLKTQDQSHYSTIFKGNTHPSQLKPRVTSGTRHNKPHPEGVGFLMQDCHTLHNPICDVKTKVDPSDTHWWPSRANAETNKAPIYTNDTTSRGDFKRHKDRPQGLTRHGCNPHTTAAQGPVPVTHLQNPTGPRLLVEHISYQHGYDSRKANNQPQRGKLHGNFVWDVLHPTNAPQTNALGDMAPAPPNRHNPLPGRGSEGMRNIMMHDLVSAPNREVRHARFPTNKKPLKPITSKVGQHEGRFVKTNTQQEGILTGTMPTTLPPIGT